MLQQDQAPSVRKSQEGVARTTETTEVKTDCVAVTVSCTVVGLGSGEVCKINVRIRVSTEFSMGQLLEATVEKRGRGHERRRSITLRGVVSLRETAGIAY